ncbi:hypothetical protein [Domibacillus tundrae]|uniref:hypothetical protein n=1 Tax=Domibacillus tundrae TaxID=1587527 RepID=UPI0012DFF415|nr:hypothetical protein [Domibacillus tundrae]
MIVGKKEGKKAMRRNNKKQLCPLEHSFLDSVLNKGLIIVTSNEQGKECEFDFHFPLALKREKTSYSDRTKERIHDHVSLTVKTLIDTTVMPVERKNN